MKETTTTPPGEELLVWKKFVGGERAAFQQLILSNYRGLVHYGTKFCRDQDFIEDVIQDLFIYLWDHKEDLTSSPGSVRNYLFKAFRHRMLFELKQQQRFSDLPESDDDILIIEPSIQETLLRSETELEVNTLLNSLIGKLPDRQREALFLKYYQNCDIEEISELMGISRQSVSNHLQKAMSFLRTQWQQTVSSSFFSLALPFFSMIEGLRLFLA